MPPVTTTFGTILGVISGLLNIIIPILITLGVVYFIWGVVQYVTSGDAEKKEQGQQHMIWGLIGLAVIVSIWGLISILRNTFGVTDTNLGGGTIPIICPIGQTFISATNSCQ